MNIASDAARERTCWAAIRRVNPTGIIPKGTPVDYRQPHDRARFAA